MEKVEAIASALEAVFERADEIVAFSKWQKCECETTIATLLEHMTATVHMGYLTPPPCLLESASWMIDHEPESCAQDTWLCGVIQKETGELVNSFSSPISKAEVNNSSTTRNSTDKAISEVAAKEIKEEIIETNVAADVNRRVKSLRTIRKTLEKKKPKVKRIVDNSNSKKVGNKQMLNVPTKNITQNASKHRGVADHSTKAPGISNVKQPKRKTQAQGLKKEAIKTDSERTEQQATSKLPEVVTTDSKNLDCDKTYQETTPAQPPLEETKQDEESPANKHRDKRITTRIPRSFTNEKTQIKAVSRHSSTRRKPQMGVSTNQNRNRKVHESTNHIGECPRKIFDQSGTIITDGFTIPTDDFANTTTVSSTTALPKTRRPTSTDRRATSKPLISTRERNGVVLVGRTHHIPRERCKVWSVQRRDVTCV